MVVQGETVPARVTGWLRWVFQLIRCEGVGEEDFLSAWLSAGRPLGGLNEGEVANFLLDRAMIDRATWEEHRRMCIVKMYTGPDPRWTGDVEACAEGCRVDLDFARRAVEGLS